MKRIILLASALAFGGVAYAQDASQTTPDASAAAPATPDASTPPTTPDASAPQGDGSMPAAPPAGDASGAAATPPAGDGSMAPPPAAGGQSMAPGGSATGTATGPSGPVSLTPTQGPADLPACSKTVTDNCKQAQNGGGGHKAARHHGKHAKK